MGCLAAVLSQVRRDLCTSGVELPCWARQTVVMIYNIYGVDIESIRSGLLGSLWWQVVLLRRPGRTLRWREHKNSSCVLSVDEKIQLNKLSFTVERECKHQRTASFYWEKWILKSLAKHCPSSILYKHQRKESRYMVSESPNLQQKLADPHLTACRSGWSPVQFFT